jgi:hypothetical protein
MNDSCRGTLTRLCEGCNRGNKPRLGCPGALNRVEEHGARRFERPLVGEFERPERVTGADEPDRQHEPGQHVGRRGTFSSVRRVRAGDGLTGIERQRPPPLHLECLARPGVLQRDRLGYRADGFSASPASGLTSIL